MAKYGVFSRLADPVASAPVEGTTCLIFVGSAYNAADFSKVFHIQSWDEFEAAFGIHPQWSLTDAAVACLDLFNIPFYAIATDDQGIHGRSVPFYFNNVYEALPDFINESNFDSYIICCLGFGLSDLGSFMDTLNPLLGKEVYYVADLEGTSIAANPSNPYIDSNGGPKLTDISRAVNSFTFRRRINNLSVTFGDILVPKISIEHVEVPYHLLGSAVRAALLAKHPIYRNAGNIPVDCGGIYGRYIYGSDPNNFYYIQSKLNITDSDAQYLTVRGVSVIMAKYGSYRTWGDTAIRGTMLNYSYENQTRVAQYIAGRFKSNLSKWPSSLTLCDRDEIIRETNAWLDSLAVLGYLKAGKLEWVSADSELGTWKFKLSDTAHVPVKSLTEMLVYDRDNVKVYIY